MAQIIDVDPVAAVITPRDGFIADGAVIGGLTFRRFLPAGRPPHPAPSLLLMATAADFRVARRIYGRRHGIPRFHVLQGTDVSNWGHRAGEEPVLSLPVSFDPANLPTPAAARQREPLLLAEHRPRPGSALEHALRQRGIASRLELLPSTRARLERAIARAPVVVDLAPRPRAMPTQGSHGSRRWRCAAASWMGPAPRWRNTIRHCSGCGSRNCSLTVACTGSTPAPYMS